ncbi:hypothetical protein [Larkinella soli]|uniref:hypothetical protein n=1 Tax=Larkinella soli TaxID=1770527 RepID=UPI000FFC2310|nr:hypothetical protein [Larkinella soli]
MTTHVRFGQSQRGRGWLLLGLLWLGSFAALAQGKTWYVSPDSSAVNDGQSWSTTTSMMTALKKAKAGDQVWVKEGVYWPFRVSDLANPTFEKLKEVGSMCFIVSSGVKVFGGFAGHEDNIESRSGGISRLRTSSYNHYVVAFFNADEETLVDGFHLVGAYTDHVITGEPYYDPNAGGPGIPGNIKPTAITDVFGIGETEINAAGLLQFGNAVMNFAYNGSSKPTVTHCTVDVAGSSFVGGMVTNFAYGPGAQANLRMVQCLLSPSYGDYTMTGAVLNIGRNSGDADLVFYNCHFSNLRIFPLSVTPAFDWGVVCALMINAGNAASTTRVVNCRLENCGAFPNVPSPNGPFYILANVFGGGRSELVNCYLNRFANSVYSAQTGWPVGFTEGVTLSHSIFGSGIPDHDVDIDPQPGQGYSPGEPFVYGGPTDPGRHLLNLANGSPETSSCNTMFSDRGDNTLLQRWPDLANLPGLADRLNNGRIDIGVDESNPNVYLQTTTGATSLTVTKGASDINLQGKYCGGTVNWSATNGTSGQGSIIPVATDQAGTVTYLATCTTGGCTSIASTVNVTVLDVSVPPPTDLTFRNDGPLTCSKTVVTLTAATTATGVSYTIKGPNGTISSGSGNPSTTVNLPGSYTVTATNSGGSATAVTVVSSQTALAAPNWSAGGSTSVSVTQGAPAVSLNATNCSGTLQWTGPGSTTGTGGVSVPTSATGVFVYSAVCQVGSCVSPPASATVTVTAPPVTTGNFEGFLTTVNCQEMRGWVWDRNRPNTPLTVEFFAENTSIGTTEAKNFRQDLKEAGKGNGEHGYIFPTPEAAKTGSELRISAKVQGTDYILKGSPIKLTCPVSNTVVNQPPVGPTTGPLSATVGVDFTTTLPTFTDPEGQPLTYALTGLPGGLQFTAASRTISGSPTTEGTFLLSYSGSDGQKTASVGLTLVVAPGSSTPPAVTGNFEGFLDKVECGSIRGWVWDRNKPNTPLTVQFFADGVAIGTTEANIYRDDLRNAGKGNGVHAYNFTTPVGLKDNVRRQISAKVLGSTYTLKGSPKPLQCAPAARLSAETGPELQVTVLGNPVYQQVQVEVRGAKGQPLRFQLINTEGRLLTEQLVEQAGSVEQQHIPLKGVASGLLFLRTVSGSKSVTLKVVKP